MAKYTTFSEVIEATIEKFRDAPQLGYKAHDDAKYPDDVVAAYSHVGGSIGCAIGCHLTPQDAAKLDEIGDNTMQYQVWSMYCNDEAKPILVDVFGDIRCEQLTQLQRTHDDYVMGIGSELRMAWSDGNLDERRADIDRGGVMRFVGKLQVMLLEESEVEE